MAVNGRLEVKGAGPTLVFHCYSTAPLPGVALSDLYGYLSCLLPHGISKYVVCVDDKQDRGPLTECCASIPTCEVVFVSETFYPFNVCDHLLWYLNRIIVPGTIVLLTNIQEGYYFAAIKTIQSLGWRVILSNEPTTELPQAIQAIKRNCQQQVDAGPSRRPPSSPSGSKHATLQWVDSEPDGPGHQLPSVTGVIHSFLTGGVLPMTPLDLAGGRELVDSFQTDVCTLDDWPFFPPDYPLPTYNNRKESHLMKLMDSLNTVDVDVTQQDVTDPQNSEREEPGVSTCGSLSYEDSFFVLDKASPVSLASLEATPPERKAAGDEPNHYNRRRQLKPPFRFSPKGGKKKTCSLNRTFSTPSDIFPSRKQMRNGAAR